MMAEQTGVGRCRSHRAKRTSIFLQKFQFRRMEGGRGTISVGRQMVSGLRAVGWIDRGSSGCVVQQKVRTFAQEML